MERFAARMSGLTPEQRELVETMSKSVADQCIARITSYAPRTDNKTVSLQRRQIFCRVHCQICLPIKNCLLYFFNENALTTYLV